MTPLHYKKIDAFTSGSSSGNPAACIYLQAGQALPPEEMQRIAAEHKGFVSEVVYCTPEGPDRFALRYYSSECEVEFCGHGTIACMYDLLRSDQALTCLPAVSIDTPKGRLTVFNELAALDAIFVSAPAPEFLTTAVDAASATEALGIPLDSIALTHPILLVNAGLNTLIVPIEKLTIALSMKPREKELKDFCLARGIDIILIFCKEVSDSKSFVRTRVFAPKFGYLEDKATGSGNSALGYYMLENGLWNGDPIRIEQNGELLDYNTVHLKTHEGKVLFGGRATVRIEGVYYL